MSNAFIGEIRDFGFTYAPKDWVFCDGRMLEINQFSELYSLLGTIYGGDGRNTFAVPDLRGRIPIGFGSESYSFGEATGMERVTLSERNMPAHTHDLMATTSEADTDDPEAGMLANTRSNTYAKPDSSQPPVLDGQLNNNSIEYVGSSEPIENRQPYLVTNYCIATKGIYPPRA